MVSAVGAVELFLVVIAHWRGAKRGAGRGREAARIGETEAGVSGGAFGERCGEDAGAHVVVVVDLGGGLAGVSAEDPAAGLKKGRKPVIVWSA